MGSFFSKPFQRKGHEVVSLEEHKKLIEVYSAASGNAEEEVMGENLSRESLGLRILAQREDRGDSSCVLNRKVEDARIVTFQSMPSRWFASVWVRKELTLCKELHEISKKRDPRLNDLDFGVKVSQQQVSWFQSKAETTYTRKGKPKDEFEELFRPFEREEDEDVTHALDSDNSQEILVIHEPSNIEISREILQCLKPCAWLNDEIINLYLELLKERERSHPNKFLKCHFFNTFFYKKLTNGKSGFDYNAVRRWTTKKKLGYTLIECDKVFVPIHTNQHWSLAVINVKDKSFQYLDSLGAMDIHVLNLMATYLMEEARDKDDKEIDTISWKKKPVYDLPLQENGWDCGMFMIKYIDFYSRGLKPSFKQKHMAYFRKRTAIEILRLRAE